MRMVMRNYTFALVMASVLTAPQMAAAAGTGIFDVKARQAELATPAFAEAKQSCLARSIKDAGDLPKPIASLKPTREYGNDASAEPYFWHVMILASRTLAGDTEAAAMLKKALLLWADNKAFLKTPESFDPYYAIKRGMLTVVAAFDIVDEQMSADERKRVSAWIQAVVTMIDKTFNGDVDHNNHRYIADVLLMAWGAYSDNHAMYEKGKSRFAIILKQADKDGALPLETRRGARAAWYMRQSLASMVIMSEIARLRGEDLYGLTINTNSQDTILANYLDMVENPLTVLPDASANFTPGPSMDFFSQYMEMLNMRPHGRHYMAFAEPYLRHRNTGFVAARLESLMQRTSNDERPLIDEFAAGNATCYWWKPKE